MVKRMNENLSLTYRFKVSGMDCAACVTKIEKAVGRISGASDVNVGMQSQTLTVNLKDSERVGDVAEAVKKAGIWNHARRSKGRFGKPRET